MILKIYCASFSRGEAESEQQNSNIKKFTIIK